MQRWNLSQVIYKGGDIYVIIKMDNRGTSNTMVIGICA